MELNKKIIIGAVLLAIAVAIIYFASKPKQPAQNTQDNIPTVVEPVYYSRNAKVKSISGQELTVEIVRPVVEDGIAMPKTETRKITVNSSTQYNKQVKSSTTIKLNPAKLTDIKAGSNIVAYTDSDLATAMSATALRIDIQ